MYPQVAQVVSGSDSEVILVHISLNLTSGLLQREIAAAPVITMVYTLLHSHTIHNLINHLNDQFDMCISTLNAVEVLPQDQWQWYTGPQPELLPAL